MTELDFVRRTRWSYDAAAETYTEWIRGELAAKPLDRAVLDGFAELARSTGGPVLDVGCGPGRVTAYLADLGLPASGMDLSPGMIAAARRTYPTLRFTEGSMLALDHADGELGGIVAWYSIIHVPDEHLPGVFAEFHRVLAPGGHVQLGFQVGDRIKHRTEAGGHEVSLDFHRRRPERVAELLSNAGLEPRARLLREPDEHGEFPEDTRQAFLLARKPVHATGR
ncbi:class I SAM-dependent methyltransferase [Actinopolyspora erythraea]|uniref:Methyltransferase n=1 Tax=Actinopolyspora erythraea TaxID=414996 RepID=A0A099D239_9ACTN|nr:class I SAM-dependent methyltransferase [Actinopolyspora erythraea]ASU77243.1 class I SAM-dependent methyltransferase [Actinopolyspora erythraea]KGI80268.1 methyltransferase [Actinopolyspora erythraea]